MSRIEFDRLTITAPTPGGPSDEVTLLRETSLVLDEHRVALIGPNGSGKSTLARSINGLVNAASGRVLVDGLDVARKGREVRRQVAFAFTDPSAQLVMPTVLEDVCLSLRHHHRAKDERERAAHTVLRSYGLDDLAHRSVHTLSGGQRQLLALASVLATDPSVLVADEPTTLLDLVNSRRIAELLFGLDQQLILATHDLELAQRCDRALLIDDGAVIADGTPGEVVAHYRARSTQPTEG